MFRSLSSLIFSRCLPKTSWVKLAGRPLVGPSMFPLLGQTSMRRFATEGEEAQQSKKSKKEKKKEMKEKPVEETEQLSEEPVLKAATKEEEVVVQPPEEELVESVSVEEYLSRFKETTIQKIDSLPLPFSFEVIKPFKKYQKTYDLSLIHI
eukprot:TRINITY_DN12668_c0_g1_i1.p1 TRINITY_DN12668_c0_g1~~TRINITY_DN12668_c0_g1_i1.p1  ORF type:complete len:151 (-),score=39.01 TRINITY_DN12668_c0_g1_i1:60-512(-)